MVSPYAVRLNVDERAHRADMLDSCISLSTFGSAAGTLLTSFYLVLYFEVEPDPDRTPIDFVAILGLLRGWRRKAVNHRRDQVGSWI